MMGFVKSAYRFFSTRLWTDDVVLLLEHKKDTVQASPVTVVPADHRNVSDTLHFQTPRQVKLFHSFLDQGDIGYLGYMGGKCVHRSWVKKGGEEVRLHKFLPLQLQEDEVFIHYCETDPRVRGKNIFAHVLCHIANEFKGKRVLIGVDAVNTSSQRSMEKAGFQEIARCRVVVIFGVKKISWIKHR